MTAEKVDGLAVIATEQVETPLSTPETRIYYTRILRLLLDDESTAFGCVDCDYAERRIGVVRHHLKDHSKPVDEAAKPVTRRRAAKPAAIPDMTLAEALNAATRVEAMGEALERLANDRNEWKARALRAERKLTTLRTLFGGES